MKLEIAEALKTGNTLQEISPLVIAVFEKYHAQNPKEKLGYVAGMITSEGPEKIKENLWNLSNKTEELRESMDFPMFCSRDIFTDQVFERIGERPASEFFEFFRILLRSGYVTDVFMTPRWEESKGSIDEHETAKKEGLTIHYL